MSEEFAIENVNKHYLDKVMDLAEVMQVEATEDIFDARGMKLIAKGAKISRQQQERLIMHKLRKPLESSIAVENGVNNSIIAKEAERIADTVAPVASILRSITGYGPTPVELMGKIQLGSAMNTILTVVERGGARALEHCVMVGMVSASLANRLKLGENEQRAAALAGLLHDIGELYIEPAYLQSTRRLLPHEWRHLVVHPRIGEMLIRELDQYPSSVATAVAEHHERFDGAGYPRQLAGMKISPVGQAVAVAEMVSGVFMKRDRPLARAELALKIIPGEHCHALVSAVAGALRSGEAPSSEEATASDHTHATHDFGERIRLVLQRGAEMLDTLPATSARLKQMVSDSLDRVRTIQRAFISTGLDMRLHECVGMVEAPNTQLTFEAVVATREIEWRLRDVARELALRAVALESHDNEILQPFIALLDHQ